MLQYYYFCAGESQPWSGSVYNLSLMASLHFIFNVKRFKTDKNRLKRISPREMRERNGMHAYDYSWFSSHVLQRVGMRSWKLLRNMMYVWHRRRTGLAYSSSSAGCITCCSNCRFCSRDIQEHNEILFKNCFV